MTKLFNAKSIWQKITSRHLAGGYVLHGRLDRLEKKLDQILNVMAAAPGLRSVTVEQNICLVRLATGQRLYLDSRDIGIASHIMTRGLWEAHHTKFMQSFIKPGWMCIDIGANFGYFSVIMANLIGKHGILYCFEPNPYLFTFYVNL